MVYVTDYEKLDYSLKLLKDSSVIAVDTETTGLDCFNNKIRLVQIASKNNPVIVLDMFRLINKEDLLKIKSLLESDKLKIFHNAKFDIKFLRCNFGIKIENYIYDTLIASQVYESGNRVGNYQLKSLAKDYLNIELDKSEQVSNWGAAELSCEQLEYACKDVEILLKLREFLNVKLKKEDLLQTALLEFEVIPVVVEMELNGFLIDPHKLSTLKECVIKEKEEHLKTLQTIMPKVDNFNSPRQVLVALNKIGVLVKSTDKQILKPLAKEFIEVDALLKYKKSDKWLGIIKKLLELRNPLTNRLHSQYNQNFTKTGRFSCYSPSIQQIPNKKEFRECFIARDGSVLIVADYSQIELRIAAEISDDPVMIAIYKNDGDIHKKTASILNSKNIEAVTKEERNQAKAINFGLLYGMQYKTLIEYAFSSYGVILTEEQAIEFRDKFFCYYTGIRDWHRDLIEQKSRVSYTLGGRRRIWAEYPFLPQLANTPVQGTGADILKKALVFLKNSIKNYNAKIIGCVHDEIIVETPTSNSEQVCGIVKDSMKKAGGVYIRKVPIIAEVKICRNWSEK